ncbi:MAG: hypothetical protein U1D30_20585 [Planctomycetota bacterium]
MQRVESRNVPAERTIAVTPRFHDFADVTNAVEANAWAEDLAFGLGTALADGIRIETMVAAPASGASLILGW